MLNKILSWPSSFGARVFVLALCCALISRSDAQTIELTHSFSPGTAEAFQRALTRDITTVSLDVSGGYLSEGLAIGRLIRDRNLRVVIPHGAVCYSACAEAFLGGRGKEINGVLAFHMPRVEAARSKRQAFRIGLSGGTATAIYRYEMGYGFGLTQDINQWTNESTMLAFSTVEALEAYRKPDKAAALPTLIQYQP